MPRRGYEELPLYHTVDLQPEEISAPAPRFLLSGPAAAADLAADLAPSWRTASSPARGAPRHAPPPAESAPAAAAPAPAPAEPLLSDSGGPPVPLVDADREDSSAALPAAESVSDALTAAVGPLEGTTVAASEGSVLSTRDRSALGSAAVDQPPVPGPLPLSVSPKPGSAPSVGATDAGSSAIPELRHSSVSAPDVARAGSREAAGLEDGSLGRSDPAASGVAAEVQLPREAPDRNLPLSLEEPAVVGSPKRGLESAVSDSGVDLSEEGAQGGGPEPGVGPELSRDLEEDFAPRSPEEAAVDVLVASRSGLEYLLGGLAEGSEPLQHSSEQDQSPIVQPSPSSGSQLPAAASDCATSITPQRSFQDLDRGLSSEAKASLAQDMGPASELDGSPGASSEGGSLEDGALGGPSAAVGSSQGLTNTLTAVDSAIEAAAEEFRSHFRKAVDGLGAAASRPSEAEFSGRARNYRWKSDTPSAAAAAAPVEQPRSTRWHQPDRRLEDIEEGASPDQERSPREDLPPNVSSPLPLPQPAAEVQPLEIPPSVAVEVILPEASEDSFAAAEDLCRLPESDSPSAVAPTAFAASSRVAAGDTPAVDGVRVRGGRGRPGLEILSAASAIADVRRRYHLGDGGGGSPVSLPAAAAAPAWQKDHTASHALWKLHRGDVSSPGATPPNMPCSLLESRVSSESGVRLESPLRSSGGLGARGLGVVLSEDPPMQPPQLCISPTTLPGCHPGDVTWGAPPALSPGDIHGAKDGALCGPVTADGPAGSPLPSPLGAGGAPAADGSPVDASKSIAEWKEWPPNFVEREGDSGKVEGEGVAIRVEAGEPELPEDEHRKRLDKVQSVLDQKRMRFLEERRRKEAEEYAKKEKEATLKLRSVWLACVFAVVVRVGWDGVG